MRLKLKDKKLDKEWKAAQKRLQKKILKEIHRLQNDKDFMAALDAEVGDLEKGELREYMENAFIKSKKEGKWKPVRLLK